MTKLKELRVESKMSQQKLAELVNVTPKYIGFLENNERTPSLKVAQDIAKVFNKQIEDIFLLNKWTICTVYLITK